MTPRSIGLATDLAVLGPTSRVEDRGEFLFVESPASASFYFGNFLAFAQPPTVADARRWPALFAAAFADRPAVRHMTLVWEGGEPGDAGALDALRAEGFTPHVHLVLTATAPPVADTPPGVEVRALAGDEAWQAQVELGMACREPQFEEAAYRDYLVTRNAERRALVEAGRGEWLGAFEGGRLAGSLGVYRAGSRARYQDVQTHPERRRRGIAGVLIAEAARRALAWPGAETLVIVSEPSGPAIGVYRRMGFRLAETHCGALRIPAGVARAGRA